MKPRINNPSKTRPPDEPFDEAARVGEPEYGATPPPGGYTASETKGGVQEMVRSDGVDVGRCTAHSSRSGERCRRRALRGSNVCPMHGAAAPQVRAKAERRVVEQKARALLARLGVPVATDPIAALQACLDEAAGNLGALRAVVAERTASADGDPADPVIRLYSEERDRLHRVAKDALALGIELRRDEFRRGEVARLVDAWKRVLADPALELTEVQARAISRGVAGALRAMGEEQVETGGREEVVE